MGDRHVHHELPPAHPLPYILYRGEVLSESDAREADGYGFRVWA